RVRQERGQREADLGHISPQVRGEQRNEDQEVLRPLVYANGARVGSQASTGAGELRPYVGQAARPASDAGIGVDQHAVTSLAPDFEVGGIVADVGERLPAGVSGDGACLVRSLEIGL